MHILVAMQSVHKNAVLRKMTKEALGSLEYSDRWSVNVDDRDVSLAEKWNTAMEMGIIWGVDYVILVNNDIIFDKQCLDNLIEFASSNPQYLVTGPTQYFENEKPIYSDKIDEKKLHWSFVCFNPERVLNKIGYCETLLKRGSFVDTEWNIRIDRLGEKVARTESSWFLHYNDTTHRLLPEYRDVFYENEAVVKTKWGESYEYEHPYNDKTCDITFMGPYNDNKEKQE